MPAALRTQAQLPETELEEEKAAAAEAEDYGAAKKLREEFGRLTEQTLRGEQHANGAPVFWLHIQKTGTSLINAVYRRFCRLAPLDPNVTYGDGDIIKQWPPSEWCPGAFLNPEKSFGYHCMADNGTQPRQRDVHDAPRPC